MNKRRASVGRRCLKCKIHFTLCFCDQLKTYDTQTRISIIMHHRETHLTSNTANLAQLVLSNCQIYLRGLPEKPFSVESLNLEQSDYVKNLFLFPHEGAVTLDENFLLAHPSNTKFHLIIPDGTWSQAVKTYRREPGLSEIQCVKLPLGEPGRYKLRKSSDENRLSTYEAMARAVGFLERNDELLNNLENHFDMMVERVIRGRTAFEN